MTRLEEHCGLFPFRNYDWHVYRGDLFDHKPMSRNMCAGSVPDWQEPLDEYDRAVLHSELGLIPRLRKRPIHLNNERVSDYSIIRRLNATHIRIAFWSTVSHRIDRRWVAKGPMTSL